MRSCIYIVLYFHYICSDASSPRPLVLWHGLGDCGADGECGMVEMKKILREWIPGIHVKSIHMHSSDTWDSLSTYTKNVNHQISRACKQIKKDERFSNGYNAVGFSQGGQFLRAVAERCSEPRMYNLITFGAQHQGIFGIPGCDNDNGHLCSLFRSLAENPYGYVLQHKFVPAQYWHDPFQEEIYRKKSRFLADINNENKVNPQYKNNLRRLENFVMIKYKYDEMVIPPESSWFGFFKPGTNVTVLKLQETALYKDIEDRLGLREMDRDGKLHFLELAGSHLEFDRMVGKHKLIFQNFLSGGEVKKLPTSVESLEEWSYIETPDDSAYDSDHVYTGDYTDTDTDTDSSDPEMDKKTIQANLKKLMSKG